MSAEEKRAADETLCRHVLTSTAYQAAGTICCFAGRSDEIDTGVLLAAIPASGRRLCLPRCTAPGQMECRQVRGVAELQRGAYGILEPPETAPLLGPEDIDLILVPCVTCDREGHRLGRGGGYYDRFLAGYTGTAMLLCREALLRTDIPQEPHDRVIPWVVTDKGSWWVK